MTSDSGPPLPPNFYCPYCQGEIPPGARFCTHCGRPLAPTPMPTMQYAPVQMGKQIGFRDIIGGIGAYTILALFLLVCANIVILTWGISEVYLNLNQSIQLYVITPFIVDLFALGNPLNFGFFLFLVAAIVLSFVWMTAKSAKPFSEELKLRFDKNRSPLFVIGTLFLAILFFQVAFYLILAAIGISTTSPSFEESDLWKLIFSFAEASVWEELISRVLLLGIPLLILTPIVNSIFQKKPVKQMGWWRYFLGGGFKFGPLEVFFLLFSSVMFGLAHLASWDLFKVLPAAAAGLAMGYLFLKFGLYASIMFHFFTDYLSMPLQVFPNSDALSNAIGLLILIFLAVGAIFFIYYLMKGVGFAIGKNLLPEKLFERRRPMTYTTGYYVPSPQYHGQPPYYPPVQSNPQYPTPQPPQTPSQDSSQRKVAAPQPPNDPMAFGYMCKNCGNMQATYKDGELICSRCGARS